MDEIKPLSKEEQIKALEYAKELIKIEKNNNDSQSWGICCPLRTYIWGKGYCRSTLHLELYIPLFTIDNAKKHGGSMGPNDCSYWWNSDDFDSRIKFIDWIINELNK